MRSITRFGGFALAGGLLVLSVVACAPRITAMDGAPYDGDVPEAVLRGWQQVLFRWEYSDESIVQRGEGLARIASPDSVRVDLLMDGGFGSGFAVLIGDSLRSPYGEAVLSMLPPGTLLWSSVGRLALPAVSDTIKTMSGGLIRVQVGVDTLWRATFDGQRLARLERAAGGRLLDWMQRRDDGSVIYRNEKEKSELRISSVRRQEVEAFPDSIWGR